MGENFVQAYVFVKLVKVIIDPAVDDVKIVYYFALSLKLLQPCRQLKFHCHKCFLFNSYFLYWTISQTQIKFTLFLRFVHLAQVFGGCLSFAHVLKHDVVLNLLG